VDFGLRLPRQRRWDCGLRISDCGNWISDCAWPPAEKAGQVAKGIMIADQTALLRLVNRKQAFTFYLSADLPAFGVKAGFLLLAFYLPAAGRLLTFNF